MFTLRHNIDKATAIICMTTKCPKNSLSENE